MSRAVVLLSSGMDSTVNIYAAQKEMQVCLAVTFDYGQRAAPQEIASAKKICEVLKVPHQTVALPFIKGFGKSSLTDSEQAIPTGSQVSIDNLEQSQKTAKSVWVPNRNGIFLNVAAGFAESMNAQYVIPGFNKEEAATFPDNSEDFLQRTTRTLELSTSNHVSVKCFTTDKTKTEIVQLGESLGVDWRLMWPCYFSEFQWCGQCESCQRSKRAFTAVGISTQTLFKQE